MTVVYCTMITIPVQNPGRKARTHKKLTNNTSVAINAWMDGLYVYF